MKTPVPLKAQLKETGKEKKRHSLLITDCDWGRSMSTQDLKCITKRKNLDARTAHLLGSFFVLFFLFFLFFSSCVGASCGSRHGPVVFCDARPEDPDHDDGQHGEKSREEAAVDGTVRACADVHADNVLENLADGKKESGGAKVDCVNC